MATASATLNNSLSVTPQTGTEVGLAEGAGQGSAAQRGLASAGEFSRPTASQVLGDPMGMLKEESAVAGGRQTNSLGGS
jgi:hypothetical protein